MRALGLPNHLYRDFSIKILEVNNSDGFFEHTASRGRLDV